MSCSAITLLKISINLCLWLIGENHAYSRQVACLKSEYSAFRCIEAHFSLFAKSKMSSKTRTKPHRSRSERLFQMSFSEEKLGKVHSPSFTLFFCNSKSHDASLRGVLYMTSTDTFFGFFNPPSLFAKCICFVCKFAAFIDPLPPSVRTSCIESPSHEMPQIDW